MPPYEEGWHWPIRVANPLQYGITQYSTTLKNHAMVHFANRLERYIKWKSSVTFEGITLQEQNVIWNCFQRRFDSFFTSTPPPVSQEHVQFVGLLENQYKDLFTRVRNPLQCSV